MDLFRLTMQILSAVLMVYFLLIMLRVIMSWFPSGGEHTAKFRQILNQLTDPYMNRFKGLSWLRFGMLDFSPVFGLALLSFALFITQRLAAGSFPGIGELLAWLLSMVWGLVAFMMMLLAIVMIVRLVTLYAVKGRPAWTDRLDAFLFPRVSKILGVFTSKTVSYPLALGICAGVLILLRFAVGYGMLYVYELLARI